MHICASWYCTCLLLHCSFYMYISGLQHVLQCKTQEDLDDITANFTTQLESFGAIHTFELIRGGSHKRVTLENKENFVITLAQFHMIGKLQ